MCSHEPRSDACEMGDQKKKKMQLKQEETGRGNVHPPFVENVIFLILCHNKEQTKSYTRLLCKANA